MLSTTRNTSTSTNNNKPKPTATISSSSRKAAKSATTAKIMGYNNVIALLAVLLLLCGLASVDGLKCHMCGQYNEGVGSITPCLNYSAQYEHLYLKECSKKSEKFCVVSIRTFRGSHICGGTILTSRWVLTAAHCVEMRIPGMVSIQFGLTKVNASGTNAVTVKNFIIHEYYDPWNLWANDIALLELQKELVFDYKTVAPVTLPEPYFETPQVAEGGSGVLIGWGFNATNGSKQSHLQEVGQRIYSNRECNRYYNKKLGLGQICAGVGKGGQGACSGDSGGPLLYNGNIQVGIVSNTKAGCAAYPDVYLKVSYYIRWIAKIIGKQYIYE